MEKLILSNSTPEEIRYYFTKAELDFQLTPTEMAELLLGNKKSYGTYKKWVTSSQNWHAPSSSVFQHMQTLYDSFKNSKVETITYIHRRLGKIPK